MRQRRHLTRRGKSAVDMHRNIGTVTVDMLHKHFTTQWKCFFLVVLWVTVWLRCIQIFDHLSQAALQGNNEMWIYFIILHLTHAWETESYIKFCLIFLVYKFTTYEIEQTVLARDLKRSWALQENNKQDYLVTVDSLQSTV